MNKQCIQCGQIMLVPDIPLPPGYTQKCLGCGKINLVADNYDNAETSDDPFQNSVDPSDIIDFSSPSQEYSSDSISSHTEFSIETEPPRPDSLDLDLQDDVQSKITHLQQQIDRIKEQVGQQKPSSSHHLKSAMKDEEHHPLFNVPVAENEALFCTDQTGMANICARKLRSAGIQTQIIDSIEGATQAVSDLAFQYIIVDQRLLHGKPEGAQFLKTLKTITLPIRRQQVVALLTPGIESGESQVFYQWGIDVNVHFDDLEILTEILQDTDGVKKELYSKYKGLEIGS